MVVEQVKRFKIVLEPDVWKALEKLAEDQLRHTQDQATWCIRQYLIDHGLMEPPKGLHDWLEEQHGIQE